MDRHMVLLRTTTKVIPLTEQYRYEFLKGKYIPHQNPARERINWYVEDKNWVYITNLRHPELEEHEDVKFKILKDKPLPTPSKKIEITEPEDDDDFKSEPEQEPEDNLESLVTIESLISNNSRTELNQIAFDNGIENPEKLGNKTAVAEAIMESK